MSVARDATVLMIASRLVVFTVATLAASVCPVDPKSAPIIEITAKEGRVPLAFFPIGFSEAGHLAWLERRQGFDDDRFEWSLHVDDLVRDRHILDQSFSMKPPGLAAFCAKHGPAISRVLEKNGVQTGKPPRLEQPKQTGDPTGIDLRPGHRDPESGKTRYEVILRGNAGTKRIGSVERIDPESGEPPVGPPKLLGILKSPFEARIAVLVTQEMIGTEGVKVTLVSVFGARVDKGWINEH